MHPAPVFIYGTCVWSEGENDPTGGQPRRTAAGEESLAKQDP
jgi:hypothetical protein